MMNGKARLLLREREPINECHKRENLTILVPQEMLKARE